IALLRSSRRVRGGVLLAFPGRCCRGQVFASAFPASRACGLLVGENTISCCIDRARGLPPGPRTRSLSGIAARQPEYVAVSPGWGVPAADLAQFTDRAASPDLSLYWSTLNREHAGLDLRGIQAVAACGNLLRLVDQVSWATTGQESVPPEHLVKAAALLRSYEASIVGALNTFQRTRT